jgi:Holliday junction resolvase
MLDENTFQDQSDESRLWLMYEACEQVGITTSLTKEKAIERFQILDRGLSAEDEFVALVNWLGRCELIHKLDQKQTPSSSKDLYRVPDFFAVFNSDEHKIPVLIETKSTKDTKLKWSAKYFGQLKRYADLLNLPLLIAWKCRFNESDFAYWTLFDSSAFEKPNESYKISLQVASHENLLGQLAGDFALDIKAGVGLHIKLKLIGDVNDWQVMKQTGNYYGQVNILWTNGNGDEIPKTLMTPELLAILNCVPSLSESSQNDTDGIIFQSFALTDNKILFTQHMLAILLAETISQSGSTIKWRNVVEKNMLPVSPSAILETATKLQNENIVNFVFHQIPGSTPAYLQEIQTQRNASR